MSVFVMPLLATLVPAWVCLRKGKWVFAIFAAASVSLPLPLMGLCDYWLHTYRGARLGTYESLGLWAVSFNIWLLAFILATAGAIRIAKPDSKWARKRYVGTQDGEQEMAIARARFLREFRLLRP
jgi:hypothetical protein